MPIIRPAAKTPPGAALDLVGPRREGYQSNREMRTQDARTAKYRQEQAIARPTITMGPWYWFDLPASATTEGQLLLPSAAATLAVTGNRPRTPAAGRVVGCTLTLSAGTVSGSLSVGVEIDNVYFDLAAGVTAGDGFAQSWIGWALGVPFAAGAAIEASILTASLSPTTLEARVELYLMLGESAAG